MSFLRRHLLPNEQLLAESQLHWITFLAPAFYSCCLLIFLVTRPKVFPPMIDLLAFAFVVVAWVGAMIRYLTTEFAVSQNRLLMKKGFIHTRTFDLLVTRIESVQLEQSLLGKILGYGDVIVNGTGGDHAVFETVSAAVDFYQKVLAQNVAPNP